MSLRFWIVLAMTVALAPLTISAIAGYVLLDRGVIAPVHDVAFRLREEIGPVQQLRVLVWDAVVPVDEYVEEGNPVHQEAYRSLRAHIEGGFAGLVETVAGDAAAASLLQRARESWADADEHATELISVQAAADDPRTVATMQRFHGAVAATSDRLQAAYGQLADGIRDDHDAAIRNYERSIWIAAIAGGISLLAMIGGVLLIGRIMSSSVDRLVEGAARFAAGDRHHRVHVQVPPELHRVANEFNYMIDRIYESEKTLEKLAHVDSLTGLPNRRAFEAALESVFARLERYGEPGCLLAVDVDHFKRINDEHGHAAGDDALRAVANVMAQAVRPFDKVFRTGGEEFFVVMPQTGPEAARLAAERIRTAVEAVLVEHNTVQFRLTISVGVAGMKPGERAETAIEAADAALYRAKTAGRNRVEVAGPEMDGKPDAG